MSAHATPTPHYQVRPFHGRFAVVYPLPGGQWGDWAALCDFRTEAAAKDHARWLNTGRSSAASGLMVPNHTPRDPAVELLLLNIRRRLPHTTLHSPQAGSQEMPR